MEGHGRRQQCGQRRRYDRCGWVTLICGFALWPVALIWAYVDVPAPLRPLSPASSSTMPNLLTVRRPAAWERWRFSPTG